MWCNMNAYKDFNLAHSHGDAVVSGVYYLKVPKNSGTIFFVNPSLQQKGGKGGGGRKGKERRRK